MLDQIMEALGQDAASQIRNETTKFDVDTQSVKRGLLESAFDKMLGREGAIQEEAKKKYVKNLEKSAVGQELLTRRDKGQAGITSETTEEALRRKLRDVREKDEVIGQIMGTGQFKGARADLQAMDVPALTNVLTDTRQAKIDYDDANNPATQRAVESLARQEKESNRRFDLSERRYLEDRISERETKLLELDVLKQKQANEMAMFDKKLAADQRNSKRERMAAIIAGLANLGGAFAI